MLTNSADGLSRTMITADRALIKSRLQRPACLLSGRARRCLSYGQPISRRVMRLMTGRGCLDRLARLLWSIMATTQHFSPRLFKFLKELRANNDRDWFAANKQRFESDVRDPFLRFIADFAPLLHGISPSFVADPRPSGGSLFRIYRDIRFSQNKSPYKTHMAARFPHVNSGKEISAPGFYLHVEPGTSFIAAGVWHPDARTLMRIRTAIAERPDEWQAVRRSKLPIEGDRLAKPPRGFDPDHRFIEDLKLKDFVTSRTLSEKQVCNPRFILDFAAGCRAMTPLMRFLVEALDLDW